MVAVHYFGRLAFGFLTVLAAARGNSCLAGVREHAETAAAPRFRPGSSLLQAHSRRKRIDSSVVDETAIEKVISGVKTSIRPGSGYLYEPAAPHRWAVALPEDCADEDVESFAQGLPEGARSLFLGTPSSTGLCVVGLEATEEQLRQHLAARPGAVAAEADLRAEAEAAELAGAGLHLQESQATVPPQEGFPAIARALVQERRKKQTANETVGNFTMERALDIDVDSTRLSTLCGDPYKVNIYAPVSENVSTDDTKHRRRPIIAVGHGYMQGGNFVDQQLSEGLIRPMVQAGYVVVAPQMGKAWCDMSQDLVKSIEWVATASAFRDEVDPNRTALVGFSMGGLAALKAAANQSIVDRFNIKAVVALMPPCQSGCATPKVPAFYGTGRKDKYCSDKLIRQAYRKEKLEPKIIADIPDAPHWEVGIWGRNRHMPSVLGFLDCHLRNLDDACWKAYSAWPSRSFPSGVKNKIVHDMATTTAAPDTTTSLVEIPNNIAKEIAHMDDTTTAAPTTTSEAPTPAPHYVNIPGRYARQMAKAAATTAGPGKPIPRRYMRELAREQAAEDAQAAKDVATTSSAAPMQPIPRRYQRQMARQQTRTLTEDEHPIPRRYARQMAHEAVIATSTASPEAYTNMDIPLADRDAIAATVAERDEIGASADSANSSPASPLAAGR